MKKKQDYQNGKVYEIVCNITGDRYVGSTAQTTLAKRLGQHVTASKGTQKYTSLPIILRGDYYINLLEKYPCLDRMELRKRERFYIEKAVCVNKVIPTRTLKEWKLAHCEHIKVIQQEYNKLNSEHIKEYMQEYRQNNFENLKVKKQEYNQINYEHIKAHNQEYYKLNSEHIKTYQQINYEHIKAQKQEYYKLNSEHIRAQQNEKGKQIIHCSCGAVVRNHCMSKHKKTQKHIQNQTSAVTATSSQTTSSTASAISSTI